MGTYGNGPTRGKGNKGRQNGAYANDYTFVDRRLHSGEKEAWLQWSQEKYKDAFLLLGDVASGQHKVTLTYQEQGDCFICSFTCNDEQSPNYHVILTSRSDVAEEAVLLNLYKFYVIYEDKAWTSEDHSNNWG